MHESICQSQGLIVADALIIQVNIAVLTPPLDYTDGFGDNWQFSSLIHVSQRCLFFMLTSLDPVS